MPRFKPQLHHSPAAGTPASYLTVSCHGRLICEMEMGTVSVASGCYSIIE